MRTLKRFEPRGSWLWDLGDGGHIFIDADVIDVINSYRQLKQETTESGGFLAGYFKGHDLHVINLTVPHPGDRCGRFYFKRRDPRHVELMKQWHENSGGEINCLGEWHTHPEPYPTPSGIDSRGWRKFNKKRQGQRSIFLIAGTEDI